MDWKGPHADEFRHRLSTGDADAGEVVATLRRSAAQVEQFGLRLRQSSVSTLQAREYMQAKAENEANETGSTSSKTLRSEKISRCPPKPSPGQAAPLLSTPVPGVGGH